MGRKWSFISLVFILALSMLLAACGSDAEEDNSNTGSEENDRIELGQKDLTLPYVAWARETAVSHLYAAVLEDIGYNVELKQVEAGPMWSSVADGSADFFTGASLPVIHSEYEKTYGDDVVKVKKNVDQSPNSLTVPSYMEGVNSIEDLKDNEELGKSVDWKITGIDGGSGIMQNTEKAMETYGLDDWELLSSSEAAMLAELKSAYDKEEPIVVTLWKPHWVFGVMDMKMLDDPEEVYGGDGDQIFTVAREGLEEDAPAAYKVLEQYTEDGEMVEDELMAPIFNDDQDPDTVVREFIDNHPELIEEWTKGVK
ncbi:glycine betaine ABC transporter substrate-binding protein [Bacillus sp. SD088]|uniref:glycine betaine ABC transporter substrate-binding protein n=1 Tax=Bacillus sp. SD088 TaxID=2782012 RepID=UPI001A961AA4|nr:glycine betaine ABC transporter substrate-binding protein [Bacillus sp. SD088]MBO0992514.1 glycine betaine ABC transporter substrate-binding protein [Bacillus sp. SD088]